MEENNVKKKIVSYIGYIAVFLVTIAATLFFAFLYELESAETIRVTIMSGVGSLLTIYLVVYSKVYHWFDYRNDEHVNRFFICYFIGLLISLICAKIPSAGWPFLVIFVLLALFSNSIIGITVGTEFLLLAVMMSGKDISFFVLYFFCGLVGICLFHKLDESYKIMVPFVLSLMALALCLSVNVTLFVNEKLSFDLFIIPIFNVILSGILLFAALKIFSSLVIFEYRNQYMEINDPEFPLLVELKQKSKDEYYRAIHIAYFCEKIARKLEISSEAVKSCGYYHKIGKLYGENSWEQVKNICEEYEFPPRVSMILKEYLDKSSRLIHKETAILLFSDAVVSSILFLFEKEPKAELDYSHVIDTIFKKKLEGNAFQYCEITLAELHKMKQLFKEEKLYYDFLR